MTTSENLTNINFMSEEQYDALENKNSNELYAVPLPDNLVTTDMTDNFVTTNSQQTIVGSKFIQAPGGTLRFNNANATTDAMSGFMYQTSDGTLSLGLYNSASFQNTVSFGQSGEINIRTTNSALLKHNGQRVLALSFSQTGSLAGFQMNTGYLIQWGHASAGATVTFPKAFSNNFYMIALADTEGGHTYGAVISDKTTTTFKMNTRAANWIAIGY